MKLSYNKGMRFFATLFSVLILFLSACATEYSEQSGWQLYRMGHYDEALANWRKAAEAGDGGAAFRLGAAYLDGTVTKRSPRKAMKWIKHAVALGDGRAEQELGAIYDCTLYKCRELGVDRSQTLAAKYYLAAARKNQAVAQYNIAVMFEEGKGVRQNFVDAYMFYTLAIENDFATFSNPARDTLAFKMSRAQIELALLRAQAFKNKKHTGLGGL